MLIFEYTGGGHVNSRILALLKLVAQLIGISTSPSQKATEGREKRFELFRQRDVAHAEQRKNERAQ
jgi:hypothetical protein